MADTGERLLLSELRQCTTAQHHVHLSERVVSQKSSYSPSPMF